MRHQAELKRVFERIDPKPFPKERHLMPLSLRTIKELGAAGIDGGAFISLMRSALSARFASIMRAYGCGTVRRRR